MAVLSAVESLIRRATARGSFTRSVATLVTGNTTSLALLFLISPLLPRLYSPAEFAVFELFLAVSMTLSHLACGKYDHGIILPESEHDALRLHSLCLRIAAVVAGALLFLVLAAGAPIARLAEDVAIAEWLHLVPIAVFVGAIAQASLAWCVRARRFGTMSAARVSQAVFMAAGQIGLGLMGVGAAGLIFSQLAGLGALAIVSTAPISRCKSAGEPEASRLGALARRYANFPRFLLPAHLLGNLALAMPLYLFTGTCDALTVGCYALANRVLGFPVTVLTGSISEVFRQRAAEDLVQRGSCRPVFIKTACGLAALALVPTVIIILTARPLFAVLFGEQWGPAGVMAQILMVRYAIKFVTDPVSVMFVVAEKQHYELRWQIARLLLTALSLSIGLMQGVLAALSLYVLSMSLMYLVIFYYSFKLTVRTDESGRDNSA